MPTELPPQYDPKSVEAAIYQKWLDSRAFHAVPDDRPPAQRYSVVIPPPNVTGALHLGHAINGTIQDILVRYHRMRGDNTLWMPGIDHAGIATQAVVEKTIFEKEKKSRHDLGRDELVRRIWEWKEQFGTRILRQLQSIGASCDWDRTRFTLDETCAKAVREAFFKMFKDCLIFRGKRLVNWDAQLQTAVADDEIYHETVKGQLTQIKYPVKDSGEFLIVATTRPETMLGDTAVAVHPDDPRYQHLIGKHVILPLVGREIPVICDGLLVDPKFGTGVVKVTPAHDPNDYATGQRHGLEMINLITPDGRVNDAGQGTFNGRAYTYVGLKFSTEARKRVLADLEALGLIADKKPHEHEVGHSDRSKTPIEPYLSDQWFVRMGDIDQGSGARGQGSGGTPSLSGADGSLPGGTPSLPGAAGSLPGAAGSLPGAAGSLPGAAGSPSGGTPSLPGVAGSPPRADGSLPGVDASLPGVDASLPGVDASLPGANDSLQGKTACSGSKTGSGASQNPDQKAGIALANGQRVSGLAQAAMDAVTDGRVKITPDRYAKGYLDWLGQKRDWCISRQLWWGHRIPVWRVPEADLRKDPAAFNELTFKLRGWSFERIAMTVQDGLPLFVCVRDDTDREVIEYLEKWGFIRDPDVLDTWFSSALWPISTMGWPATGTSPAPDDQLLGGGGFYPTSVLSTARDILTLWVARMVMFGLYCKGDVPFRNVYVHPVIQDGEGKIMSKSKGNGVDPVDIIGSHGADALRFTLASLATETQDIRMPVVKDPKTGINTSPKFDLGRNFANKIWNATRFILSNLNAEALTPDPSPLTPSSLEDRWILSRLNATITATDAALNAYRFADVANGLYQFFWTDLCDWYLEIAKDRIKGRGGAGDATVQQILLHCLRTSLALLHPIMPFITEELWSKLPTQESSSLKPQDSRLLITSPWPTPNPALTDPAAEAQIAAVQEVTRAIRDVRNQYAVPPSKPLDVTIKPRTPELQQTLHASRTIIEPLANAKLLAVSTDAAKPHDAATAVLAVEGGAEVYVAGVIDKDAEKKKLAKRREDLLKFIAGNQAKLANDSFTSKAPAKVVEGLRTQLAQQQDELAAIDKNLAELDR